MAVVGDCSLDGCTLLNRLAVEGNYPPILEPDNLDGPSERNGHDEDTLARRFAGNEAVGVLQVCGNVGSVERVPHEARSFRLMVVVVRDNEELRHGRFLHDFQFGPDFRHGGIR